MKKDFHFEMLPQPDDSSCGPTCLHGVYRYFNDPIELARVIEEVRTFPDGGTLDVWLACHALRRGYSARIYTYNLMMFDPTWFRRSTSNLSERLLAQMRAKNDPKLRVSTKAYRDFLALGGELNFEDLTTRLIRRYLTRSIPILTGISSTYLYRCAREFGPKMDYDDIRGLATGHFVVLCGYQKKSRRVMVADPNRENPLTDRRRYPVNIDRLICAILLGVLTYDANLLIIEPRKEAKSIAHVDTHRGQPAE